MSLYVENGYVFFYKCVEQYFKLLQMVAIPAVPLLVSSSQRLLHRVKGSSFYSTETHSSSTLLQNGALGIIVQHRLSECGCGIKYLGKSTDSWLTAEWVCSVLKCHCEAWFLERQTISGQVQTLNPVCFSKQGDRWLVYMCGACSGPKYTVACYLTQKIGYDCALTQ